MTALAERKAALIFYASCLWYCQAPVSTNLDGDEIRRVVITGERETVIRQDDDCR